MKVIRQIVYESPSALALDLQLKSSLQESTKFYKQSRAGVDLPETVSMTITTTYDERVFNKPCPLCTDPTGDFSGNWCEKHKQMGRTLIELMRTLQGK